MKNKMQGSGFPHQPGHFVQFYQSENSLLTQLATFIEEGVESGETCIVVATDAHLKRLETMLPNQADLSPGQYIALDAVTILEEFMVGDMPDCAKFLATIGTLVKQLARQGKPLRIYGEMVAMLWKNGNKDAVLQLENLWNELINTYSCTLFCAYPELHFIMDRAVRNEISDCHSMNLPPALATR